MSANAPPTALRWRTCPRCQCGSFLASSDGRLAWFCGSCGHTEPGRLDRVAATPPPRPNEVEVLPHRSQHNRLEDWAKSLRDAR